MDCYKQVYMYVTGVEEEAIQGPVGLDWWVLMMSQRVLVSQKAEGVEGGQEEAAGGAQEGVAEGGPEAGAGAVLEGDEAAEAEGAGDDHSVTCFSHDREKHEHDHVVNDWLLAMCWCEGTHLHSTTCAVGAMHESSV